MDEIIRYNCIGMHAEKTCDKIYTHHTAKKINGILCVLAFCQKHAEQYDENEYNLKKKGKSD